MALIVGRQILIMVVIIAVGFIVGRIGLMSDKGVNELSGVLLYVINPLLILMSFQQDYSAELMQGFVTMLLYGLLIYVISTALAILLTFRKGKNWEVDRSAYIYRNVGFFGIPVINSIYGAEGVFYLSAFIAAFNIWCWSYGVTIMKDSSSSGFSIRRMLRNMINPSIIMVGVGMVLFVLQIRLPSVIGDAFNDIGSMNTAIAMMITGIILGRSDLRSLLDRHYLFMDVMVQLVMPFIEILIIRLFPLDDTLKVILGICAACPVASTVNMFALRFGRDYDYASKLNIITTISAAATIPLLMLMF